MKRSIFVISTKLPQKVNVRTESLTTGHTLDHNLCEENMNTLELVPTLTVMFHKQEDPAISTGTLWFQWTLTDK